MAEDDDIEIEDSGSTEAPEIPHPRENTALLGHEVAEAACCKPSTPGGCRMPG